MAVNTVEVAETRDQVVIRGVVIRCLVNGRWLAASRSGWVPFDGRTIVFRTYRAAWMWAQAVLADRWPWQAKWCFGVGPSLAELQHLPKREPFKPHETKANSCPPW